MRVHRTIDNLQRRTKTGCDGGGECSHKADENDWQAVGPVVGRLRKNRHGNLLPYDKNNKYRTGIGYSTDCVVGSFAVNKQIVLVPFNKHPPPHTISLPSAQTNATASSTKGGLSTYGKAKTSTEFEVFIATKTEAPRQLQTITALKNHGAAVSLFELRITNMLPDRGGMGGRRGSSTIKGRL